MNTIKGNNSTTIGTRLTIEADNSLAAGSKVKIDSGYNSSFARHDGSSTLLTIKQSHLFAVKGEKGMVVGKDTPHPDAALSIQGALRIQLNPTKNTQLGECTSNLVGTVKTVKAIYNIGLPNEGQVCPCLCDGKNGTKWTPMLTTPQCINACEERQPQAYT